MSAVEDGTVPLRDSTDAEPGERQTTVVEEAPFSTSTPFWEEKLRICRLAVNHPEGATITQFLRDLHGRVDPSWSQRGSDAPEYQRVRRFVTRNPDFFEVEDSSGVLVIYPTLELVSLIFGGITQNPPESGYTAGREFCQQMLKSVRPEEQEGGSINWEWSDTERWYLRQAFEDYLSRINDMDIILRAENPEVEPEYLSMPYKTRFNDSGRINKQWSILNKMIEQAGEWYDTAVFCTLTTRPARFDNLHESITSINENFNRLMSWLQTDSRLGYRPDYVKVLEFQESGNPHLHVLFFLEQEDDGSMPWLVDKSDLDEYWAKWQGGYINDLQPLVWRDDLPEEYDPDEGWIKWDADGNHGGVLDEKSRQASEDGASGYQTAGQYLGKYISATYGAIMDLGTDETIEEGAKYEDKSEPWKLAMYWATSRKIKTGSMDLRQAVEVEDDEQTEVMEMIRECRYEVVGAFTPQNMPMHIWREVRSLDEVMRDPWEDDQEPWPDPTIEARDTPPDGPPDTLADELAGSGMLSK